MALIALKDIRKTYHLGKVDVPVLKGVSLEIQPGEMVALMGASGSGKTTLMNTLGCLDRPSSGSYWLDGEEVGNLPSPERALVRNRKIGFVFQTFNLLPRTSALDNVLMPLAYVARNMSAAQRRQRARELLERVGLGDRLDHEPSQLSGGQQQRVAIARALINRPALLLADEPTGNLDSKTSEEILQMFQRLNAEEGITILLVTHDAGVANHARRVIRIKDGLIEDDRLVQNRLGLAGLAPHLPAETANRGKVRSGPGLLQQGRFLAGIFAMALGALRRNVLRSALTMLGIIIGVAAVISTIEVSQGSSTAIQQTIASMGANNLVILPGTASSGGVSMGGGSVTTLVPEDVDAISRECPAVNSVAPIVRARTQVVHGNKNWVPINIYGTTPGFLDVREWPLLIGASFDERDVRNGSRVCLLGRTVARELFGNTSPVGKDVRIQNVSFKVVGLLSRKGANMMGVDQDDIVLAPWTTIKSRISGSMMGSVNQSAAAAQGDSLQKVNSLSALYPRSQLNLYPAPTLSQMTNTPQPTRSVALDAVIVRAVSLERIPDSMEQINSLLHTRHHIRPGQLDDFNVRDMTEMTKALSQTVRLMTLLVLIVALISLAVGGVGIMNIMLVSVTERTREIGLRMAVGARAQDILRQFLAEAVVLCLLGGAIGILIGRTVSFAVRLTLHWPTETSLLGIAAAVLVSVTVGVVFGYYPAWKASRLDPIVALRYE